MITTYLIRTQLDWILLVMAVLSPYTSGRSLIYFSKNSRYEYKLNHPLACWWINFWFGIASNYLYNTTSMGNYNYSACILAHANITTLPKNVSGLRPQGLCYSILASFKANQPPCSSALDIACKVLPIR